MITYEENILFIENEEIDLFYPISKVLLFEDRIAVLLDSYEYRKKTKKNNNILCYDTNGNLLWQIEDVFVGLECSFVSIEKIEDKLFSNNWCDFRCQIDINNGNMIGEENVGRF